MLRLHLEHKEKKYNVFASISFFLFLSPLLWKFLFLCTLKYRQFLPWSHSITADKNIKIQIGVIFQIIKGFDIFFAVFAVTNFSSFHFSNVASRCLNDTWREGARRRQGISWLIHCLLPDNHDKVINE